MSTSAAKVTVGGPRPGEQGRAAEVYDFRRPTTLVREHSRALEVAFETFARQWATQLTAKVRVVSSVTFDSVGMHTYDDYVASLPPTTAMVLCEIDAMPSRAIIEFPTTAALAWIGHMLGGNGSVAVAERKLTQVEQALITSLAVSALEDLSYSLGGLLSHPMQVHSIQHNSQFAQAAPTGELMIVAGFTMRVGEQSNPGTVAIPADAVLPQLGDANPTESAAHAAERILEQVARTPVEVSVRLAPATVLPSQVLDLGVGDIIRLPHPQTRLFNVVVDDTVVAGGAGGQRGSHLACVIATTEETPA